MTTVVIPAAGAGTRFAAPYAKELHLIAPGVSVINTTMTAISALGLPNIRVVVVISPDKLDVAAHLLRDTGQTIAFVGQRPHSAPGLGSALLSAEPWCDDTILMCLGDQVYQKNPTSALSAAITTVDNGTPVAVVAARCASAERLATEGALQVVSDVVCASTEKPENKGSFNACWSSLAFTRSTLPRLAAELSTTTVDSLVGAPVFWGPGFINVNRPADAYSYTCGGDGL